MFHLLLVNEIGGAFNHNQMILKSNHIYFFMHQHLHVVISSISLPLCDGIA